MRFVDILLPNTFANINHKNQKILERVLDLHCSDIFNYSRSLRAPPTVIRDILEGVLRLMGTQDTSWNSMKTFLAKRGVKDEILSFDARRISSKNREIVEKLLEERSDSFDPQVKGLLAGKHAVDSRTKNKKKFENVLFVVILLA